VVLRFLQSSQAEPTQLERFASLVIVWSIILSGIGAGALVRDWCLEQLSTVDDNRRPVSEPPRNPVFPETRAWRV
jgi:hypothetical protein